MKTPWLHGLLVIALAAPASTQTTASRSPVYAPRTSVSEDPIDLWMKLMPVFSHPRCANCHGGVDPFKTYAGPPAIEHPPGVIGNPANDPMTRLDECADCHDATEEIKNTWVLASLIKPDRNFFGKGAQQICEEQAEEVIQMPRHTPRTWPEHLRDDVLITQSFDGLAGGARHPDEGDPPADPPPMKRMEFLAAADKWLDSGAVYGYPLAGGMGTVQVNETAARDITFDRRDGMSQATFEMSGHSTIVQTMNLIGLNRPCQGITTSHDDWTSLPARGTDVSIRVLIEPSGSYIIRFSGPIEKTRTTSRSSLQNNCGAVIPHTPQEPPAELEWPKWSFTIRCPSDDVTCERFDPSRPALSGSMVRTIVGQVDGADPQSWLNVSPAGTSRADDGTPIPITVKTNWELTVVE